MILTREIDTKKCCCINCCTRCYTNSFSLQDMRIIIKIQDEYINYHLRNSLVTPVSMDYQEPLQKPELGNGKVTSHYCLKRIYKLQSHNFHECSHFQTEKEHICFFLILNIKVTSVPGQLYILTKLFFTIDDVNMTWNQQASHFTLVHMNGSIHIC